MNVPVLAAHNWRNNAEMIADCARLGYLAVDRITLDPTFGRGKWWTTFRPEKLFTHDLRADGVDFRDLPYDDATFDDAVFDPPYMAPGGRETSTMTDFNDRFGTHNTPRTPLENQQLINDGLSEVHRVVKPRGFVLVKCMDYVNSGRLFLGTHHTLTHGLSLGFECFDRLEHWRRTPSPQPAGRRQVHARRNYSTLLVFRKGR